MSNDTDRLLSKIQQNTTTICTTLQRMQEELLTISQTLLKIIAIEQQNRKHALILKTRKRRIRGMGPVRRLNDEQLEQVNEFWPEFAEWYKTTHDENGRFVGPDKWLDLLESKRVVLEEVLE